MEQFWDDEQSHPENQPDETVQPSTVEPVEPTAPPKSAPAVKAPVRAPARPDERGAGGERNEAGGATRPAAKGTSKPKPVVPAIWATGRRKEAIARIRLIPGNGQISVNTVPYDRYFPRETLRLTIRQPLLVTHQLGKYDVFVNVVGGGLMGQAGAVRLGIARALTRLDPALRQPLRGAGFLTRDPRMKERKKYGQKGARKRFQWTKR